MKHYLLFIILPALTPAHVLASSKSSPAEAGDPSYIEEVNQKVSTLEQAHQRAVEANKKVQALQEALEEQAKSNKELEQAKAALQLHVLGLQNGALRASSLLLTAQQGELVRLKPTDDADEGSKKEYAAKRLEIERAATILTQINVALDIGKNNLGRLCPESQNGY